MRVLHVTSGIDPRQGGPTTALVALVHAQLDAGLSISVASTFGTDFQPTAADHVKRLGADVHLIGPCARLLAYHHDIKPTLQRLVPQADVVHVHGVWEHIQHRAARVAKALGVPYILTPHGMLDPWSLSQGALKKRLYLTVRFRRDLDQASAIHFTDAIEQELVAPLKIAAPGVVERLIIDLSDFHPAPARGGFRPRYPQLGDRPIALFMSRIHRKKGLDLLIPAFAQTVKQHDAMLVIAGPDTEGYRAEVERMIAQHEIADRVLLPGMLYGRDRAAAIVDADVFVLPSYQENFGIVVIESLAAGTPVIISDQVNIHGQIRAADVGEVVPTKVEAVRDALLKWLTNEPLRREASQRALDFVAREYDRTTLASRWVKLYEDVIARHRAR